MRAPVRGQEVPVALEAGGAARVEPSGAVRAASTRMSRGRRALSAAMTDGRRQRLRVETLATWPSAWTPASVRLAPTTRDLAPGQRTQRLENVPLDRRRPGLDLPAVVGGAVVGQQEGQPGGGRLGVDRAYRPGAAPPISSAICTALVAAPLRS